MRNTLILLLSLSVTALGQVNFQPRVAATNSLASGGGASSLLTGLAAYWKMDEASGTRADSTANAQTLTDNNTVTSAAGKVSNAGDFELDNTEYLSHVDSATLSMGDVDFTIAGWVKLESKGAFDGGIVVKDGVGIANGATCEYGLLVDTAAQDRFRFCVGNNTTFTNVSANNLGSPSLATWYFIVAWHDSVNNEIGIQINNGTADTVTYNNGSFNGSSDLYIGSMPGSAARALDGLIDELGIWTRILTAGEKTTLYNSGNGTTYPF